MKKSIVILMTIMMILTPAIIAYADINQQDFNITVSVTALTKNVNGKVETYFSPGDDMILEYTIKPEDIKVSDLPETQPIDVGLVLDTSGSMNDPSSTYEAWRDANTVKYTSFDKWLADFAVLDTTSYEAWRSQYAKIETFEEWKVKNGVRQETFEEWKNTLHLETFAEWKTFNKIVPQSYEEWLKNHVIVTPKWYGNEYYCNLCNEEIYWGTKNHWNNNHDDDYVYNNIRYNSNTELENYWKTTEKIYIYNTQRYASTQLENIWVNLSVVYIYISKRYTPDELSSYWDLNCKDKFLYDGKYFTDAALKQYWQTNVSQRYLYNGQYYTRTQLQNNIWPNFNNRYVYNGQPYTDSNLKTYWTNNIKSTRIADAKRALVAFVEEMSKAQNADKIDVSIITFENSAEKKLSFSNVKNNKATILSAIDRITANGGTNGGDGLRLAYHELALSKAANKNKNQYIVYLGDGQNYAWTEYKDDFYYGDYNGYVNKDNNRQYYSSSINGSKIYWIYDESSMYAKDYVYSVAKDKIAVSKIKTYVVGVGDGESSSKQSLENQMICKNANNITDISKLYFSVNDASKLSDLYAQIAKDIRKDIPIKNISAQIPFKNSIQFKGTLADIPNITNVYVNGVEMEGFNVADNKLSGAIADFNYVLNEDKTYLTAAPIILSVKVHIPDKFKGIIETTNALLAYTALDKPLSSNIPSIKVEVMEGLKPIGVDATLNIRQSGAATLIIIPKADCNEINIKTTVDSETSIQKFVNVKKDTGYTVELTSAQLAQFLDKKIYVETVLNTLLSDNTVRKVKGIEEVNLISFRGVSYDTVNYTSDTNRTVGVCVDGEINLNSFTFTSDTESFSDLTLNCSAGYYKYHMNLKHGNNNLVISAKNKYDNTTILNCIANVNAKRPVIATKRFKPNEVNVRFTDASNNIDTATIKIFSSAGTQISDKVATRSVTDAKAFSATFTTSINRNDKIEIDGLDIYNNGVKQIFDYALISQIGLFDKSSNNFFAGTPNVVFGSRYSYAVKFIYGGQPELKMTLSPDIKISSSNAYIKDLDTNTILTEASNKFKMIKDDLSAKFINFNLVEGREYLLVYDVVFSSALEKTSFDTIVQLGSETETKPINVKPLPKIE